MEENREPIPRSLVALISSLISQVLILIFLLFPPSDSLSITLNPNSSSFPRQNPLFPLLHHFLAATDIAAAFSLLSFSRKRKRADGGDTGSRLGRLNSVVSRNPDSFRQFFRMKASTFEWLCGLLEPLLDCRDPVDSPLNLPAEARLGIGLFRLATGADYTEISTRFGVSESDSKFCVKQLCRVLCTNYRFWVGFPSHTELDSVSAQIETLTGLPNCCGIITCARFILQINNRDSSSSNPPPENTIAAQIVVDSSSRILSIAAGYRCNKTDLQILKSSTLYKDIENGEIMNSQKVISINGVAIPQYLLADGEYPLLPWLIVPYTNPNPGSAEENFNNVHRLMCVSSSKAVASLKNWGILTRPIDTAYKAAVACIGACSILHNMLIMREDYSGFSNEEDDRKLDDRRVDRLADDDDAVFVRNALASRARS